MPSIGADAVAEAEEAETDAPPPASLSPPLWGEYLLLDDDDGAARAAAVPAKVEEDGRSA